MQTRFQSTARDAVIDAVDLSRRLRHSAVGCEHLALATLRQPGEPAQVCRLLGVSLPDFEQAIARACGGGPLPLDGAALSSLGINLEALRKNVEETFGPDALDRDRRPFDGRARGKTAFTDDAKRAFLRAVRDAGTATSVSALHLAIAVIRVGGDRLDEVLAQIGVSRAVLLEELEKLP
jgi:ATP-dependent Clp protease ATP-binding subunit ClpA